MKPLPIGISDYKQLLEEGCYYVDKTLLIHELLSVKDKVTLLCRPRRFGKTLNLSMLKYFFERTPESNAYLFEDKKVWEHESTRVHQGQHPVIFISFKDVKSITFQEAYENITLLISKEFERHRVALKPLLIEHQSKKFTSIIDGTASVVLYQESLLFLAELLHQAYGKQVIVLLDEYDTPIHAAYTNGYYDHMIPFIKTLLSKVLKDNVHLERGVLTGILRTAKEGVFSGLNNLTVCTLLSNEYADKFGFTQIEVEQLLRDQHIAVTTHDITAWYNGYRAGDAILLYNPWSIVQCAKNQGVLRPYWVNTSDNKLIETLLARATNDVKIELETIMQGNTVVKIIEDAFTFAAVEYDDTVLWSLLLFSGYVTYAQRTLNQEGMYEYALIIPNRELSGLYRSMIRTIIKSIVPSESKIKELFDAMEEGRCQEFCALLQEFVTNATSFYDFSANEPEKSYHLFVLGILVGLEGVFTIRSNRESGYGRYDIMLIPHDKQRPGVIIEFKKAINQKLEEAADAALAQIECKQYETELRAMGVSVVRHYGIAFQGKQVLVKLKNSAWR